MVPVGAAAAAVVSSVVELTIGRRSSTVYSSYKIAKFLYIYIYAVSFPLQQILNTWRDSRGIYKQNPKFVQ